MTDIDRVLVLSTDKIYGEGLGATTAANYKPTEPYSTSKICQELICQDYIREFNMNISIPRSCNVFGYDPYNFTRLIPATIIRLMNTEPPVVHDPKHMRQYIYVKDVVKLLTRAMKTRGVSNISSPFIISTIDMVKLIMDAYGLNIDPVVYPAGFYQIKEQSMSYGNIDYKYKPMYEAITETVKMFRNHWRK
jgi:nucleoside-diphosphate-sugar epimerase